MIYILTQDGHASCAILDSDDLYLNVIADNRCEIVRSSTNHPSYNKILARYSDEKKAALVLDRINKLRALGGAYSLCEELEESK
jgi:hypothetical protein